MSYWEHFNNGGGWNKTHESGWFLDMTRTMMLTERGNELWLAPFVTSNWLKDGMVIEVKNAPTHFGTVGYKITSSVDKGFIETVIDPPKRNPPEIIVLRLRHPDGKKITSVKLNGKPYNDFTTDKELIRLHDIDGQINIKVMY